MDWENRIAIGLIAVVATCVALVLSLVVVLIHYEYKFAQLPLISVNANLVSRNYRESTRTNHYAPIFGEKGDTKLISYSTGHDEQRTTIWDCEGYGRLVSTDEKVYRYAKPNAVLYIRSNDHEARICGIEEDLS